MPLEEIIKNLEESYIKGNLNAFEVMSHLCRLSIEATLTTAQAPAPDMARMAWVFATMGSMEKARQRAESHTPK